MSAITKQQRIAIAVFTALVVLLAGPIVVPAKQNAPFITRPDNRSFDRAVEPFATIDLPNGDVIDFVDVRGRRNEIVAFLVVSIVHRSSPGYQVVERLRGANALEVFNALTERGTPIPRELRLAHRRPVLGPQGWAIPVLLAAENASVDSGVCNSTATYQYQLAMSYGLATYNQKFESSFDGPNTKPQHWHEGSIGGWGFPTYNLHGAAYKVTSFSTAAAKCQIDSWWSSFGNVPQLNWVKIKYRLSGSPHWATYKHGQITQEQYLVHAELKLTNYNMPSATEFDFRLEILGAEKESTFRIGAAWQKKVGDLVLGR